MGINVRKSLNKIISFIVKYFKKPPLVAEYRIYRSEYMGEIKGGDIVEVTLLVYKGGKIANSAALPFKIVSVIPVLCAEKKGHGDTFIGCLLDKDYKGPCNLTRHFAKTKCIDIITRYNINRIIQSNTK